MISEYSKLTCWKRENVQEVTWKQRKNTIVGFNTGRLTSVYFLNPVISLKPHRSERLHHVYVCLSLLFSSPSCFIGILDMFYQVNFFDDLYSYGILEQIQLCCRNTGKQSTQTTYFSPRLIYSRQNSGNVFPGIDLKTIHSQ